MRAVAAPAANRGGHSIKSLSEGCAKQARLTVWTVFSFFDEQIFVCREIITSEN